MTDLLRRLWARPHRLTEDGVLETALWVCFKHDLGITPLAPGIDRSASTAEHLVTVGLRSLDGCLEKGTQLTGVAHVSARSSKCRSSTRST